MACGCDTGTDMLLQQCCQASYDHDVVFRVVAGGASQRPLYSVAVGAAHQHRKSAGPIATIDDGTYGYCVDTGEEIGIKRLEGRPMAERTVDAQERWEHKKKQLGD